MNTDLAKALYDRRKARELTLVQLSELSGVSVTHIARIERMERFPSGRILRKLAEPLGFSEIELLKLAGYLSPQAPGIEGKTEGKLDPYVARVLSQEPIEVQRAVIAIVTILKSMTKGSDCNMGFAEYAHRKYPELDEDVITMIEDILSKEGEQNDHL